MPQVNGSKRSQSTAVRRYAFIVFFMASAFHSLQAQQFRRPLEPVMLVVNADDSLKAAVTEVILKEFKDVPDVNMRVFVEGQLLKDYRWSISVVVDETSGKSGSKNGGYVMAAAFTNPSAVFDPEYALTFFQESECIPKSKLANQISHTRIGVSDLKSMMVWGGNIGEGFAGPAAEIAAIFVETYLPEIQQRLLDQRKKGNTKFVRVPPPG